LVERGRCPRFRFEDQWNRLLIMTVAELIEELKQFEPDRLVVMSKDGEGNAYSPLSSMRSDIYVPDRWSGEDSTYSGQVYLEELTPELEKEGFSEEDSPPEDHTHTKALIFWPTN
jgi:hypothetical protein